MGSGQWVTLRRQGRVVQGAEEELGREEDPVYGEDLASLGVQKMSTQTFTYFAGKKDEPGVLRLEF